MIAWLIYDEAGAKRNADYIQMHYEIAHELNIELQLIMDHEVSHVLSDSRISRPDFCFVRTISPSLSKQLEKEQIRVFNSFFVSEICNDKGKAIVYIKEHTQIPVIKTECFKNEILSKELLSDYKNSVIKAVDGHGGQQVFQTSESYSCIKDALGGSDFIIQPFIKGPGKDIRVYIIGNRIIGAVERTSKEGFKSNFSLGGMVIPYEVSEPLKSYVKEICNIFEFGMVGIDFIVDDKGEFWFNEIEDVVGARMFYHCYPNINILKEYFLYIKSLL